MIESPSRYNKVLKDLSALLLFGEETLTKFSVDYLSIRKKKILMLQIMAGMHHYANAIKALLEDEETMIAEALLRPMFESLINLDYVNIGRSDERIRQFSGDALYGSKGKLGQIEKQLKYRQENPDVNTWQDTLLTEELEAKKGQLEAEMAYLQSKGVYKRNSLPDLRMRARAIDEQTAINSPKNKSRLEWQYLTIFSYLSEGVHMGPIGLDRFAKKHIRGVEISLGGANILQGLRAGSTAYTMYLAALDAFSHKFRTPTRAQLKPYFDIEKEHSSYFK